MPQKTADNGNALIECSRCHRQFDKGCPPVEGQNDDTFVCDGCQEDHNAKHLATVAPTVKVG